MNHEQNMNTLVHNTACKTYVGFKTVEMLRTNAHGLHFVSPQLLAVTGTCLHMQNVSVCRNANFSDDIGSSQFQLFLINTYISTLWSVKISTIIFSNTI